jgi:hypothetical protein
MRTCKGNLLFEAMMAVFIMGILLIMTAVNSPKTFHGSPEESPVILLGLLNEEMRSAAEMLNFTQIRVNEQTLIHTNHRLVVTKRSRIDEQVRIYFGSTYNPRFRTNTSFKFEINGKAAQSGGIYFYRNNKVESVIMIHVGTLAMEIR